MITNCKNCGLPIFHGAAGYVGAQCRCGFSAKPNYDNNALADLLKERDQLKAENWQLKEEAKWATEVTGELVNERDQQAARIAELQKDADRYRWLRDNCDRQWDIMYQDIEIIIRDTEAGDCEPLDEIIDKAMGEKNE